MHNKALKYVTFILTLLFIACSPEGQNSASNSTSGVITSKENQPSWAYSEEKDRMEGTTIYFASCISANQIDFAFPYNGGSFFTLWIRNGSIGNEVILQVSKGQFIASFMSSNSLKVKFDNEKPVSFQYNSPSDGSMSQIFIDNPNRFLKKLKRSKKLMIEASFYNEGNRVIEFNVEGLKWNRK
jgi:hypothetical protein